MQVHSLARALAATSAMAVLAVLAPVQVGQAAAEPGTPTVGSAAAPAAQAARKAKVRLTLRTPKGMPATVVLDGRKKADFVVAKGEAGKKLSRTLKVRAGRFKVVAPVVEHRGALYVAKLRAKRVQVRPGRTQRVTVKFRKAPTASDLVPAQLTGTSVSLEWKAPKKKKVSLRRAAGPVAPATVRQGSAVKAGKGKAVDSALQPGQDYSYSLFTKVKGSWVGPLSVTVGTTAPAGSMRATYVAAPRTEFVKAGQVASVKGTGEGVALVLGKNGPVPLVGSAMVLPQMTGLAGGYLGEVVSVSPEGLITLRPAAFGLAFDYYSLAGQKLASGPIALTPAPGQARVAVPGRTSRSATPGLTLPSCLTGQLAGKVSFAPTISIDGSFEGDVLMKQLDWLPDVPRGARLAASLQATLGGAMSLQTDVGVKCGIDFQPLVVPVSTAPVPVQLNMEPVVEVTAGGSIKVTNLGATATAGMWFKAQFGVGVDNYADGGPIASVNVLSPKVTAAGAVGLRVGGDVILGPGAGSPAVGAVAGVRGQLDVLKAGASFLEVTKANDPEPDYCGKIEVNYGFNFDIVGKAWIPGWEVEDSIDIPGAKGEWPYGGPWYYPKNCEEDGKKVFVLLVEEENASSSNVASALQAAGYEVTSGTELPAQPLDHGQIWVFGVYGAYPQGVLDGLANYMRQGGSVFINSEHSCCDAINRGVDSLLDSVVLADVDVVTACTDPCVSGATPLAGGARGDIDSTPNPGVSVHTDALGYYENVPGVNQLVVLNGYVGGTVWGPSDMVTGKGRLVTLGDSNWANTSNIAINTPFVQNVAAFLDD